MSQGSATQQPLAIAVFSGLLVPFMGGVLADTLRGFTAMNEALRDRTMSRSSSRLHPTVGLGAAQEESRR